LNKNRSSKFEVIAKCAIEVYAVADELEVLAIEIEVARSFNRNLARSEKGEKLVIICKLLQGLYTRVGTRENNEETEMK
jgi:hypothetical protein